MVNPWSIQYLESLNVLWNCSIYFINIHRVKKVFSNIYWTAILFYNVQAVTLRHVPPYIVFSFYLDITDIT